MKTFLKIVGGLLLLIVVVALGAYAWASSVANAKYQKHWTVHEAPFPIPWKSGDESDSLALAVALERGRHLVDSRVGCKGCHGDDLGGGLVIDVPVVARWAAPNLTSGTGGVTRGFTSRDWDHAVRHGVRHDGRTSSMPCEEFINLSDHELSDIVAYIQSVPPVDRDMGPVTFGPVFKFVMATDPKAMIAFNLDHQKAHAAEPPMGQSAVVVGEHIVQVCRGCHGPNLSGGKMQGDPNMPIVANLTPHATGLKGWTEENFVRSLRAGKRPDGTAISEMMPWKTFGQMTDEELAAVWAYLQTVPPVEKGVR